MHSDKADVKWIESFIYGCKKMSGVGTFVDSDNYSNERLWIDFANLLKKIGVYFTR